MTAASEFPRRILAIASGMTPQVLTDTLYALAIQSTPAFVPTEIRIITTLEGAERARLTLLDPGPCPPLLSNFNNYSTNATRFTWNFGDNSGFSYNNLPSHVYNQPGNYDVTLYAEMIPRC